MLYFLMWHSPHFILATTGFSEVCDRREFSMDGLPIKPPIIQVYHGLLGNLFITELQKRTIKTQSEQEGKSHRI